MRFAYFRKSSQNQKDDYLHYLPVLLQRTLKNYGRDSGQGKDLLSIYCDNRTDIPIEEIRKVLIPVIAENQFKLYEDIQYAHSNFQTVGILYADIVGYLMARIETIVNDSELFESIPPEFFEQNGKIRKLKTSLSLIKKIRSLSLYEVK